jgi:DNA-binding transcriptional MocR family regulator
MPDEIIITSGSMQGLSLVAQALGRRGDTVLVEQPTYMGMIHILEMQGLRPIPIPFDAEGPELDAIERALRVERPRFMYTVPTFHNPTGFNMSSTRRRDLLQLASRNHLPIVEDDIYGMLAYDAPPPLAMKANDPADLVIYISSFSKVLMPGLRVGYMVAPQAFYDHLLSLKRANDLFGTTFVQHAVAEFLRQGRLRAHLKRVLPVYRSRRDALLRSLARYMPSGVTWTKPTGGYSSWVTLPEDNMLAVYRAALGHGLAFTPGEAFLIAPRTSRHLRLCFGNQPAEDIADLVAILGDLIRNQPADSFVKKLDVPIYAPLA